MTRHCQIVTLIVSMSVTPFQTCMYAIRISKRQPPTVKLAVSSRTHKKPDSALKRHLTPTLSMLEYGTRERRPDHLSNLSSVAVLECVDASFCSHSAPTQQANAGPPSCVVSTSNVARTSCSNKLQLTPMWSTAGSVGVQCVMTPQVEQRWNSKDLRP